MANCLSCGAALPEKALYCPNCGVKQDPVEPTPEPAAPASEPVAEPASEPVAEPVAAPTGELAAESAPIPADQPVAAPIPEPATPLEEPVEELIAEPVVESAPEPVAEPAPKPVAESVSEPVAAPGASSGAWGSPSSQQPVYAQGCVAAAVRDVKDDPLLMRNVLLLGLISCVPVLNFVVEGYAVNWAREIPFGGRTRMPNKIITGRNFEIGFYMFLIALVVGLVAGLASSILAVVPLIGWLAGIAVSFGGGMFQSLMQLRMGVAQQLSEGFKISAVWNVLKRDWKGLFCAALVPSLVAAGAICVLALVGVLLMTVASLPVGFAGGSVVGAGFAAIACIVAALVCVALVVVCAACIAAAVLVTMRAVAHWIARYAPEWADELQ